MKLNKNQSKVLLYKSIFFNNKILFNKINWMRIKIFYLNKMKGANDICKLVSERKNKINEQGPSSKPKGVSNLKPEPLYPTRSHTDYLNPK